MNKRLRNQVLSSFKKPCLFFLFFIERRQSLSVIYSSFSFFFFFFFFFRQVANCCTWTRRPWLFNIHTLLSYMFTGEITRIQTHDAVIFSTKGKSTGSTLPATELAEKNDENLFHVCHVSKPTWPSLSLHLWVCFFFLFFFIAFL